MAVAAKKNVYRLGRERAELQEHHSLLYWCAAAFALAFLWIAPFQTGLFYGSSAKYEGPIYSAMVWTAIASLVLAVYCFNRWRLSEVRDAYAVAVWVVPLGYLLSLVNAVSRHHGENLLLFHVMYAVFFLTGLWIARNRVGHAALRVGIVCSAYAVVAFCLLNMFGNVYFYDAVMRQGNEVRLTSVFQYANAFAGFLIVPLLCGLQLIVSSRKWYVTAVHAVMLVPVLLSFFLTLSRGGLVMLPFILLAFLPFLAFEKQIRFFVYLLVGSAASLLITDTIRDTALTVLDTMTARRGPDFKVKDTLSLFDPLSFGGWSTLLVVSLLAAVAIVLLHHAVMPRVDMRIARIAGAKHARLYFPGLIVLGLALGLFAAAGQSSVAKVLPEALAARVQSINLQQHSVLERFTMYRDTFKALRDYPLFGAGGNAWANLYPQYANNPYTVNQVHSFLLQYMVEIGSVGVLLLVAFVGSILYLFARRYFAGRSPEGERDLLFYAVVVAILFHSLMDFEMSYVYVSALVFLSLGGLASGFDGRLRRRRTGDAAEPVKPEKKGKERSWRRYALPACFAVVSALFLVVSVIRWSADSRYNQALQLAGEGKPLEEVLVPLDKALRLQPDNPYYALIRVNFMEQVYEKTKNEAYYADATQWLASIKRAEPYDRNVFEAEYAHYMAKNKPEEASVLMQEGLKRYPWVIAMYERAAALHLQLGENARQAGMKTAADSHWSAGVRLHEVIVARLKKLESLPEGQMAGSAFGVTPSLSLTFGQMYFIRGDAAKAAELLAATTGDQLDAAISRPGTRWYLAALQKAGKPDQALYDKFTSRYPEEKQEIEAIVSTVL
ncbi:O-antigen ligase family protein [Paenibacillus sp. GYB003]|uniref:O-antigen ligase family protein n=1 Tax=Paenibacillus sp. GYB003 TaxID=2994392 RepID=UPI002F960B69